MNPVQIRAKDPQCVEVPTATVAGVDFIEERPTHSAALRLVLDRTGRNRGDSHPEAVSSLSADGAESQDS